MQVEIWSDIVCPWCYIGKRRFEKALAAFEHRDSVEVIWRSFELDPSAPREYPGSLDEMLATKYRTSLEQAKAMNAQVSEVAAGEGLNYRLTRARPGNTFDAHRLIHFASSHGLQAEAKERLLQAYFNEGQAIGNRKTLVTLATELGLNEQAARSTLESDAYANEVRADERRAQELGISGVPFFVVGGRYGISGAQGVEVFEQVLQKAWRDTRPLTMMNGATEAAGQCDDGRCRS